MTYTDLYRRQPTPSPSPNQPVASMRQRLPAQYRGPDGGQATNPANPAANAGPYATLAEQLADIRQAAKVEFTSGRVDPRLIEVQRRGSPAGASELIPSDGGFLIQNEFSHDIVKRVYDTGQILSRCLTFPLTQPHTNGLTLPSFDETSRANGSRLGGVTAAWANESDSIVPSKGKFKVSNLTVNKLIAAIYCTDELLSDSNAVANWLTYALSEEIRFKAELAICQGSGAGQPVGIINSDATIIAPVQVGQGSGTFISANAYTMLAALWTPSLTSAIWIYNQALLPYLSTLHTSVGTSGSESKEWVWAGADGVNRLVGIPAFASEYCSMPGVVGDICLVDFSRYVIAMRSTIEGALSLHVRFLTQEQTYRATWRMTGSPLDAQPVTPLNAFGGTVTSPYVTLAARP
jgi:HK97 family phage major capsid protein